MNRRNVTALSLGKNVEGVQDRNTVSITWCTREQRMTRLWYSANKYLLNEKKKETKKIDLTWCI